MDDWICPECGGRWMRNYVYRHVPNGCSIGAAEDRRLAADNEDGRYTYERPATPAELRLAEVVNGSLLPVRTAQFVAPDEPTPESTGRITVVTRLAGGIFHRVVAGIDAPERGQAL